jgi:SanA protein
MVFFKFTKRWLFLGGGGLLLAAFLVASLGCQWVIRHSSSGRTFAGTADVPKHRAALVLGCTKILSSGRPNVFFRLRIEAAAALFHAGRVEYLIVSGDNSREGYDEPGDMRHALIAAGVPEDRIYRDYAGFRTLDSVVRAREIFGQDAIVIVSQRFHNERAIFIARGHGIEAVGFNAEDVAAYRGMKTKAREWLARWKTVLDVWVLGTGPKFLGPPVELGGPVS